MIIAHPTPIVITRRIGGLSSILNPEIRTVIWTRAVQPAIRQELRRIAAGRVHPYAFITLSADPVDRVRQQLAQHGLHSQFLTFDISMLIMAFADLSNCERIRVSLNAPAQPLSGEPDSLRLLSAYAGVDFRRHLPGRPVQQGQVAIMRGDAVHENYESVRKAPPTSLYLQLDAAPKKSSL